MLVLNDREVALVRGGITVFLASSSIADTILQLFGCHGDGNYSTLNPWEGARRGW